MKHEHSENNDKSDNHDTNMAKEELPRIKDTPLEL
jgi:hypothetical protein